MKKGLVLDASVIINVLGSGFARRILDALATRLVVADVTSREIVRNPLDPLDRSNPIDGLVAQGVVERSAIDGVSSQTFISLVGAAPPDELGDGESGAIALAAHLDLAVALDDGKARRVCRDRFPQMEVVASVELFTHPNVSAALGSSLADAVHGAMNHARMRVLPEHRELVSGILGSRAEAFPMLRKSRG